MTKKQKHENFKRIAEQRTNEVLDKIKSMENFTNTSFYDYDFKDIEKIYTAILKQLNDTALILRGIKKRGLNLWPTRTTPSQRLLD